MNYKRLFMVLIILTLLLALTACVDRGNRTVTGSAQTSADSATATYAAGVLHAQLTRMAIQGSCIPMPCTTPTP